jgi:glycosyltransferase involved in cell wall biosynthesis
MVLSIALICFTLVTIIFVTYFFCIIKNHKKRDYLHVINEAMNRTLTNDELPKISILIPAYNEEKAIETKLKDVAAMQYPHSKREVVLIDDCSTDNTVLIAKRAFRELNLHGKIVRNNERTGPNGCYNRGLQESTGDLIATTDADVMVDHDALLKSVKILDTLRDVGGLFARMMPISTANTAAVNIEGPYRKLWDGMFVAESAIHSTFPGYTNFTLVRRSAFPTMRLDYGSSDANISFAVIRKGLRYVCIPTILFYEPVAESLR